MVAKETLLVDFSEIRIHLMVDCSEIITATLLEAYLGALETEMELDYLAATKS